MKQYKYLTLQDRELFEREYAAGTRIADIAEAVGIHLGTAYKELARGAVLDQYGEPMLDGQQRQAYSAEVAQRKVQDGLRRRGKHITKTTTDAVTTGI